MKIEPEHYQHIKQAIAGIDKDLLSAHIQNVKESGKYQILEKRIMFDCLDYVVSPTWICDNLYSYMNDDHLWSALKKINKELGII